MHACDAGRADAICGSGMMKRTLPPFVKQLLIDLRDKVWALLKENAELRDSFAGARSRTEQQLVWTLQWTALTTALADKESEVFSLTGKLKKLETQRQLVEAFRWMRRDHDVVQHDVDKGTSA